MKAYKYETTIQENGTLIIPELKKYKSNQVEVFIIIKPQKSETIEETHSIEGFLDDWFGYFPQIDTDDIRYNAILGIEK